MDKWIVFSGPACPWCTKAKGALVAKDIEFEEVCVDSREKFIFMQDHAFGHKSVPVIWHNGTVIPGYPALVEYLKTV